MERVGTALPRREFLRNSTAALGAALLCSGGVASCRQARAKAELGSDYYTSRRKELMERFHELGEHAREFMAASYGAELSRAIDADSSREFESLIPEIPYIGGDDNHLTEQLVQATMALALHRAMSKHGKSVEETGEVLQRIVEAMIASYPRLLTRAVGLYQMSGLGQRSTRRAALESQKRRYPADWVYRFVEGDGEAFDWGIDFTECGIVKLFRAQGAEELAPYMCRADFPMSEAFGTGLVRTTTIAEGGERCDFRFKRGRPTSGGRRSAARSTPEVRG